MKRKIAHSETKESFFEEILSRFRSRKIIKLIPPDSRVLDLGSGFNGKFLQKIRHKISSGVGVDISVAKVIIDRKINLLAQDLNNPLPFCENDFDVVTSLANLEHLENPQHSLQEIFRVLKPGGILLLTTPSVSGKPVLEILTLLGLVSKKEIRDHKNYFSKKILCDLCKRIGFSSFTHRYFQLGMNNLLIARK